MKNIISPSVVYTALQNINIFTLNLLSRNSLKSVCKYLYSLSKLLPCLLLASYRVSKHFILL